MTSDMFLWFFGVLLCSIRPLTSVSYQDPNFPRTANQQYDSGADWTRGQCSTGLNQSPINILRQSALDNNKVLVNLGNYSSIISNYTVSKMHQSVTLGMHPRANQSLTITISNGSEIIRTEYHLYNLHFHWNCTEHYIDSQSYALELHFVHYNRKYGNFQQAAQFEGGLSVLAVLFKISDKDNEALNTLFEMVKGFSRSNPNRTIRYSDLLPEENFAAYHYNGSLTTPSCNEAVSWNVASELSYVSRRQILEFQRAHNPPVPMNCRRLQMLHDRPIYKIEVTRTDGASLARPWFTFYALTILVIVIHLSKNTIH